MTSLAKTTHLLLVRGTLNNAAVTVLTARHCSSTTAQQPVTYQIHNETPAQMFRDFKYKITRAAERPNDIEKKFVGAIRKEEERPLVFVFGWAGATDKNLDKYAEIYRKAGCDTFSYILPTRFIFSCTAEVPHLSRRILDIVDKEGLNKRPVFFHNLSDTGLMAYQGIDKVCRDAKRSLDIRGNILDSCPGLRPKVSVTQYAALMAVNYFCSRRDGQSRADAAMDSWRLLAYRGWPNLLKKWRGDNTFIMSEIDDTWCGDFMRRERRQWPELFLYSKRDFYLPWRYMEETVDQRRKDGREVVARRFPKSKHVSHLPGNRREYVAAVHDFLELAYFSKLQSSEESRADFAQSPTSQPRKIAEMEEEEELEDMRRATAA